MSVATGPVEKATFPLTPTQIEAFAARSPALATVLRSEELRRVVDGYVRDDARSIKAQESFRKVATALNASVLATAVISALILVLGLVQQWLDKDLAHVIAVLLGVAGLVVGGYASARLYELNAGDLAGYWMRSRAHAEKLRSEFFDRLVVHVATADVAAKRATLDLVIAHLLEDQLGYFMQRGARHEEAASRWLRWAAFATGVASIGVAAGGMAGLASQTWIFALAAVGSIGSAIVAYAAAQETIGQERERGQRFRNNVDALELLARQIDSARDAIDAGSTDVLATFTTAVNQQLALELGRFLEGAESIRASIAKLGEQVDAARKQKEDTQGGQEH
jgi:hypothetical protein